MPAVATFALDLSQRAALAASQRMVDALSARLVAPVEMRETHISWILLTGDIAYKIKKPLNLGFLDFSALEARRAACAEELRLNQRMMASIYLDVVPITGSIDAPEFAGGGTTIDYAVRMRRFPDDAMLDTQLAAGRVEAADMEQLAATLAEFHSGLPAASAASDFGDPITMQQSALDNFAAFAGLPDSSRMAAKLATLEAQTRRCCTVLQAHLIARKQAGRVRECHGDFHIGNLVRLASGITAFDALEFDPRLRWTDVMNEIAFLAMDLEVKQHLGLAYRFLNRYLQLSGDYAGLPVLAFYIAYRAMVRAKVKFILKAEQENSTPAEDPEIIALLELAERYLKPTNPLLVITFGMSGSGKTTVARSLAERLPAIHIRSDVERKRMHSVDEFADTRSGVAAGLYAPDASAATYRKLEELAVRGLESGFSVLIDAACLRQAQRAHFSRAAEHAGSQLIILEVGAPVETLEARVRARGDAANDASEAGIEVLHYQLQHHEPLTEAECRRCIRIDSETGPDYDVLLEDVRRLRR